MTDIVRTKAQIGLCHPHLAKKFPAIAFEAIEAGQPVFFDPTTKRVKYSDANDNARDEVHAIALEDAAAGDPLAILKEGAVYGFTGSVGTFAYVSVTAGELADTAAAVPLPVGMFMPLTDRPTMTPVLYVDITWAFRDFIDNIE